MTFVSSALTAAIKQYKRSLYKWHDSIFVDELFKSATKIQNVSYSLLPDDAADVEDATAVSTAATLDDIASTELCCSCKTFCWFTLLKKLVPPRVSEAAGKTVGPIDIAVDRNPLKFKLSFRRKSNLNQIWYYKIIR